MDKEFLFGHSALLTHGDDPPFGEDRVPLVCILGPNGLPVAEPRWFKSRVDRKDKYIGSTPSRITPEIERFARELTGTADVNFVEVRPLPSSRFRQCYRNCEIGRQVLGGEMVLGYLIWTVNDIHLSAEHHCVLRLPNGVLCDLTPDVTGARRTLVALSDQPATPEFINCFVSTGTVGASKALVDHPLVHRALRVLDEATAREHEKQMEGVLIGRPYGALDRQQWLAAVAEVERLIDAYYRVEQRRKESEQRHARRKRQKTVRQARKRNRHEA